MAAPMGAIGMAGQVAGGVVGAMGARAEGNALYNQGMYQSAVAEMNAKIAKSNASKAITEGSSEVELKEERGSQIIGAQRAGYGAGNVSVQSGTPIDVENSTRHQIRQDAEVIMRNAGSKAYAFLTQAANFTADSALYQSKANYAQQAAGYKVASSLIGAATGFSKTAVDFQNAGVFA